MPPALSIPSVSAAGSANLAAAAEFLSPKYTQQEIMYQQQLQQQKQQELQLRQHEDGNKSADAGATSSKVATYGGADTIVAEAAGSELEAGAANFDYNEYEQQMAMFEQQQQRFAAAGGAGVVGDIAAAAAATAEVNSPPAEGQPTSASASEQQLMYMRQMQMHQMHMQQQMQLMQQQMQMQLPQGQGQPGARGNMHFNRAPPASIPTHHLHNYAPQVQDMYYQMHAGGHPTHHGRHHPGQFKHYQQHGGGGGRQHQYQHQQRQHQHQHEMGAAGGGSVDNSDNMIDFEKIASGADTRLTVMVRTLWVLLMIVYMSPNSSLLICVINVISIS